MVNVVVARGVSGSTATCGARAVLSHVGVFLGFQHWASCIVLSKLATGDSSTALPDRVAYLRYHAVLLVLQLKTTSACKLQLTKACRCTTHAVHRNHMRPTEASFLREPSSYGKDASTYWHILLALHMLAAACHMAFVCVFTDADCSDSTRSIRDTLSGGRCMHVFLASNCAAASRL